MIKFKDLIIEDKIKVYYTNELVADYSGQQNFELGIYRKDGNGLGKGILGMVEYTIYDGEITVSHITVIPKYRKLGIGSRLMKRMKDLNPTAKYKASMLTPLGAKFKHKTISKSDMDYIYD